VIFDEELSPRHLRELERILGNHVRVMDRTALILDIFALHAHTSEGMLQVELAQYEYYLPRLTRQWTHLARKQVEEGWTAQGGGLRGPVKQPVDRRQIRSGSRQKKELENRSPRSIQVTKETKPDTNRRPGWLHECR
jgi:GTP-binding protein HflX